MDKIQLPLHQCGVFNVVLIVIALLSQGKANFTLFQRQPYVPVGSHDETGV